MNFGLKIILAISLIVSLSTSNSLFAQSEDTGDDTESSDSPEDSIPPADSKGEESDAEKGHRDHHPKPDRTVLTGEKQQSSASSHSKVKGKKGKR